MVSKFALGRTVITANAQATIERLIEPFMAGGAQYLILGLLQRHAAGDWGNVGAEDRAENERALRAGDRLMSVYTLGSELTIWIITEWDRSVTTVLLPEDY